MDSGLKNFTQLVDTPGSYVGEAGKFPGVNAGEEALEFFAGQLNLLDLAGLTAGEVLVATGAAAAAWQSTGVVLSAPDISGVVTAASPLTMPALTLGGAVTLGGQIFDAGSGTAEIDTTGIQSLRLVSTSAGSEHRLRLVHYSPSPAVNDYQAIYFISKDGAGAPADMNYGLFLCRLDNITDGAEASSLEMWGVTGGAVNKAWTLSGAGALWSDLSMDTLTYKVSGTQVVSAQGAAVADATDADSTMARLNDLLGRLRTHGLIAT